MSARLNAALAASLALAAALGACDDHNETTAPFPAATSLAVLDGNGQSAAVNTAEAAPVRVQVLDQHGKPLAGAPLTWSVSGSGGALAAPSAVTDSAGVGTAMWTLGTAAGTDTVRVSTAALPSASPAVLTATATAGPADSLVVVSGNQQSGTAGSALATPLAVRVVDAYGNPVAGATVTWATASQGTLASATVMTDATGLATDTFTLDPAAGMDPVTASITLPGGTTDSATFNEQGS